MYHNLPIVQNANSQGLYYFLVPAPEQKICELRQRILKATEKTLYLPFNDFDTFYKDLPHVFSSLKSLSSREKIDPSMKTILVTVRSIFYREPCVSKFPVPPLFSPSEATNTYFLEQECIKQKCLGKKLILEKLDKLPYRGQMFWSLLDKDSENENREGLLAICKREYPEIALSIAVYQGDEATFNFKDVSFQATKTDSVLKDLLFIAAENSKNCPTLFEELKKTAKSSDLEKANYIASLPTEKKPAPLENLFKSPRAVLVEDPKKTTKRAALEKAKDQAPLPVEKKPLSLESISERIRSFSHQLILFLFSEEKEKFDALLVAIHDFKKSDREACIQACIPENNDFLKEAPLNEFPSAALITQLVLELTSPRPRDAFEKAIRDGENAKKTRDLITIIKSEKDPDKQSIFINVLLASYYILAKNKSLMDSLEDEFEKFTDFKEV